jgi:hypothetical protein
MLIIEYLSKSYQHFLHDLPQFASRKSRFVVTLNGATESELSTASKDIARVTENNVQLSTAITEQLSEFDITALFSAARSSRDILLFDKADLLFEKKTALKRAHERNTGFDLNNLFKNIAKHNGIVILAPEKMHTLSASMSTKVDVLIRFPSV